ncbi:MAG: FecR domain-containing protein, partial [Anaerolineae bacterium]|nr:FecR domain-containing protein [Anaerolineae bacterium]
MSERQKARALSESLDALLHRGGAGQTPEDEEIRALSELGQSLRDVSFRIRPAHQARIEGLLLQHQADLRQGTAGARRVVPPVRTAAPLTPRWFRPLMTAYAGLAFLIVCAFALLLGTDIDWQALLGRGPEVLSVTTAVPGVEPDGLPTTPRTAFLRDVQGAVFLQTEGGAWIPVRASQIVRAGQRVRTDTLSAASLVFCDGSLAHLGPGTEISVEYLGIYPDDGARIVELAQWSGESEHHVISGASVHARYWVQTPSGLGEARGTLFHVHVLTDALSRFTVDRGAVSVTNTGATVTLGAGQLTTVAANQAPGDPAFRITGEGLVTEVGETWAIAGSAFSIRDGTVLVDGPQVGDWVSVDGYLTPDGTQVADRVVLHRRAPANRFIVAGTVGALGEATWTVDGQRITVGEGVAAPAGLEVGDLLHVEGAIYPAGTLVAWAATPIEDAPGSAFRFTGVVQDVGKTGWSISGIPVQVDDRSPFGEGLGYGEVVEVRGLILDDGAWLARSVSAAREGPREFEFAGYLQEGEGLAVSGIALASRSWTEVDAGAEAGSEVRVDGQILADGTWVAAEVEPLGEGKHRSEFVGIAESVDPLIVSGIRFSSGSAGVAGGVQVGSVVKVKAWIAASGERIARQITPAAVARAGLGCVRIRAAVATARPGQIKLAGGPTVHLREGTSIVGEIAAGSTVEIEFCAS